MSGSILGVDIAKKKFDVALLIMNHIAYLDKEIEGLRKQIAAQNRRSEPYHKERSPQVDPGDR